MLIAFAGWALGFGVAAGWYARQRDRPRILWALFGAILGPGALLLLAKAPPGRCRACRSAVRGWTWVCAWCGSPIVAASLESPGARPVRPSEATPVAPVTPTPAGVAPAPAAPTESPEFLRRSPRVAITPHPAGQRSAVRRGRATPARSAVEPRRTDASPAPTPVADEGRQGPRMLASGVFVNGTVNLEIGSRYLIAIADDRLRVTGPADQDPTSVVFERSIHEMDATGANDRLVLSQRSNVRGASVLAFIALAGGTPESVAEEVVSAALAVQVPNP